MAHGERAARAGHRTNGGAEGPKLTARRPGNGPLGADAGRPSKVVTHSMERAQSARIVRDAATPSVLGRTRFENEYADERDDDRLALLFHDRLEYDPGPSEDVWPVLHGFDRFADYGFDGFDEE